MNHDLEDSEGWKDDVLIHPSILLNPLNHGSFSSMLMAILRRPVFEARAVVVALQPAAHDERANQQEDEEKKRYPGREGDIQQHQGKFSVSSFQLLPKPSQK